MSDTAQDPSKFVIPALGGFYQFARPFSWVVVRFGVGWLLLVHGYVKLTRGMDVQTSILNKTIPEFSSVNYALSHLLAFVEGVGGLCIILGLFTRFFSAAAAIQMGFLTFYVYWNKGFSWLTTGYEFTLLWGIMCLAISLRGGGPWSLDRRIGREL